MAAEGIAAGAVGLLGPGAVRSGLRGRVAMGEAVNEPAGDERELGGPPPAVAASADPSPPDLAAVHVRGVLFPTRYAWYILASSLDIMLTDTVLRHFGAIEVNTLADRAIGMFGIWGLIGLKFLTVIVVVLVCEYVGRRRPATARRLAEWAIAISAVPVVISLIQLVLVNTGWLPLEEIRTIRRPYIDA